MVRKKNAQGLSMNMLVMAALALIILVVLITIFTKYIGSSTNAIQSCFTKGGKCKLVTEGCDLEESRFNNAECPKKNTAEQICCVKVT